jgi:hypothetical protein
LIESKEYGEDHDHRKPNSHSQSYSRQMRSRVLRFQQIRKASVRPPPQLVRIPGIGKIIEIEWGRGHDVLSL